MSDIWNVTFIIARQKGDQARYYQSFPLEINPDEYVLDGIERVWAFHDRSLTFRHACHHSTCGACGMLVNGVEKLTCITPIRSVTNDGGIVKVEPLRNFPVVSDLVVDMSRMYANLGEADFYQVGSLKNTYLPIEKELPSDETYERLVDCIECGLCISACPVALTTPTYLGPAVLAAIQHGHEFNGEIIRSLEFADTEFGAWRCHSGFECSVVCPSNVDPAWRIMDLRKRIVGYRIKKLFGKK